MQARAVVRGVHAHRLDTELIGSARASNGNLAAIGDQQTIDGHGVPLLWHCNALDRAHRCGCKILDRRLRHQGIDLLVAREATRIALGVHALTIASDIEYSAASSNELDVGCPFRLE